MRMTAKFCVSGDVTKSIYIFWEQIQCTTLSTENRGIFESSFGNSSLNLSKGWFNYVKVIAGIQKV